MNSFGLLTSIGSTPPSSSPLGSRSNSADFLSEQGADREAEPASREADNGGVEAGTEDSDAVIANTVGVRPGAGGGWGDEMADEKSPLLGGAEDDTFPAAKNTPSWHSGPKRIATAVINGLRIVIATIMAPVRYLVACFYDEEGNFSIFMPLQGGQAANRKRRAQAQATAANATSGGLSEKDGSTSQTRHHRRTSSGSSSSGTYTDSELDSQRGDGPARHTRSQSGASGGDDEAAPARRSIRIKLYNQDALDRRRAKEGSVSTKLDQSSAIEAAAAALKSPTGSATVNQKLTHRYPRTPAPPRPLVPKRQASYTALPPFHGAPHQKTLIIDLDETLIHSHSKGGRYTAGHMVEVKMNSAIGAGGVVIAPQVPILYYVHKRPFCDEFLRKVSKWYNLVIFTASVQEYADPVIDWLEVERKYFSGRYYRQHCTQRNGAYIKDLAHIEPDLSKVMILDNSPVSYVFHEDNAIPIEGWISDPTDNGLLHLIPLLEGLQYATDVRAVLSLRLGQPQAQ